MYIADNDSIYIIECHETIYCDFISESSLLDLTDGIRIHFTFKSSLSLSASAVYVNTFDQFLNPISLPIDILFIEIFYFILLAKDERISSSS
jgi:hypothetical protein